MHGAMQIAIIKGDHLVPVLKPPPKQSKNESLQVRVSAEFKSELQHYAQFLEATPSYVVTQALTRIFAKDREFKAWLEQHTEISREAQIEVNSTMEEIRKA
jgi:predicted transcriptional regulator